MSERIPASVALRLQLAAITGNEPDGSYIELRPLDPDGGIALRERAFIPVRHTDEIIRRAAELAPRLNVFIGACPRTRQSGKADAVERAWTAWVDLDGRDALERLAEFRPLPAIVIRTGSADHAHAYWPLRDPVSPDGAHRANRRLALALGGDMGATDPARILRPAGTLNHKHDPAAPVICTRLETDVFDLADIVASLPDSDHYRESTPPRRHFQTGDPSSLLAGLARTVAGAQQGNRNKVLYWAACRVREHDQDVDVDAALAELRQAASHAGLGELEIDRTLASALDVKAAA